MLVARQSKSQSNQFLFFLRWITIWHKCYLISAPNHSHFHEEKCKAGKIHRHHPPSESASQQWQWKSASFVAQHIQFNPLVLSCIAKTHVNTLVVLDEEELVDAVIAGVNHPTMITLNTACMDVKGLSAVHIFHAISKKERTKKDACKKMMCECFHGKPNDNAFAPCHTEMLCQWRQIWQEFSILFDAETVIVTGPNVSQRQTPRTTVFPHPELTRELNKRFTVVGVTSEKCDLRPAIIKKKTVNSENNVVRPTTPWSWHQMAITNSKKALAHAQKHCLQLDGSLRSGHTEDDHNCIVLTSCMCL